MHCTFYSTDEGRFKDDYMEGQGTMKMDRNAIIPKISTDEDDGDGKDIEVGTNEEKESTEGHDTSVDKKKHDWMIPLQFQSDISHIHQKAGFTQIGL